MLDGVRVTEEISIIALDEHRFVGPQHRHEEAQLLYAVSGVIAITTEAGTWVVPPNRAVWIPPGLAHETSSPAGVQFRCLLMTGGTLEGMPSRCMVAEITPLIRELILKMVEFSEKMTAPDRMDAVIRLLLMELSFLSAQPLSLPLPRHRDLARLCDQIRMDLTPSITVEEAAERLHMSRATFMRFFKRETGLTFANWRQQARMLGALVMLADGRNILDVALDCGYNSPSAFSSTFRRVFGKPPSLYFE